MLLWRKHCVHNWRHCFSHVFLRSSRSRRPWKLVVYSDVSEKVRHGLPIVDSPYCFWKNQTDIHSLYLGTLQLLHLMRDSIRHHHLVMAAMENKHCYCCVPQHDPLVRLSNILVPLPKFQTVKPYSTEYSFYKLNLTNFIQGKGHMVQNVRLWKSQSIYAERIGWVLHETFMLSENSSLEKHATRVPNYTEIQSRGST